MSLIPARLSLVLLLALPAFAQQRQVSDADHPMLSDRGRLEGRLYSNKSLGLAYELPEGFFVNSDLPDTLRGPNLLLLIADQHTGRPQRNCIVMFATDASQYPWTGQEFATKYVAEKPSKLNIVILRDVYRFTTAGQELFRIDYQKTDEGKTLYESFVCIRWKSYIVGWTFVSLARDELDQIVESVKTLSLR